MQIKEFSVKQMLIVFIIINSLIIFIVMSYLNSASRSNPSAVKGLNLPTPLFQFENTSHFKSSLHSLYFEFPAELGVATSIIQENSCSPLKQGELISFSNFPKLNIIINPCDEGLNMFIPERKLKFDNQNGKLRFAGLFSVNLRSPDTYDLKLLSAEDQSPNILITATFNKKEITQEELSVLVGSLIYSMNFD